MTETLDEMIALKEMVTEMISPLEIMIETLEEIKTDVEVTEAMVSLIVVCIFYISFCPKCFHFNTRNFPGPHICLVSLNMFYSSVIKMCFLIALFLHGMKCDYFYN